MDIEIVQDLKSLGTNDNILAFVDEIYGTADNGGDRLGLSNRMEVAVVQVKGQAQGEIVSVAVHEIGHAVGMEDTYTKSSCNGHQVMGCVDGKTSHEKRSTSSTSKGQLGYDAITDLINTISGSKGKYLNNNDQIKNENPAPAKQAKEFIPANSNVEGNKVK